MSPRITHRSSLITRFTRLALVPALLPALLLSVLLQPAGVALAAGCEVTGPQSGDELLPVEQRALLNVARQLPLEVKIGQLLMPGFVGTAPDGGLLDRARRGHIGGFFFLGRNVRDTAQVRDLTAQLSRATAEGSAGILPFMATDFEGGMVNALRAITGNTTSAAAMAAGGVAAVEARGAHDAAVLKSLGFNVNLAPVADVLSSPSQVIGSRAFSSDPATAATLSRAYLRGLQGGGVLGVMKHFPGHGATAGDSHVLLPTVPRSLTELEAADLLPYRQAFEAGEAQAVMVGHLLVPALDPERPTSISPPAVAGLLRDRMRFDGVVLTDELKMGAVSRRYSVGQAAVMAIQAGVDVILADYTSAEQDAVSQTLAQACRSGQLPPGRLERSVVRVLRLKLAYGLAGPQITAGYAAQMAAADAPPLASLPVSADPDLGGLPLAELPDGASGRLYTEAAGSGDFGYAVTDEGGVTFWRSYADGGGPPVLGYPISQRFELDGSTVQATQRA
ncbi:MAG: glycoside hydrolase family 3 N-terminal domain-containing protein [Chloroflexota bacterium]